MFKIVKVVEKFGHRRIWTRRYMENRRSIALSCKKIKRIASLMLLFSMCFFIQVVPCVYANNTMEQNAIVESADEQIFKADLELNNRQESEVVKFDVKNMFPGDSIYQEYNVTVSCSGDVTVKFRANTGEEHSKLEEVLKTKITMAETNEVLYDGLMVDMPKSLDFKIKTDSHITKKLQYDIVTYLDTSVGNEYMNKCVDVNFEWWVDEVENLDGPQTGDDSNILMWSFVMVTSFMSIIVLMFKMKKEGNYEQK